MTTKTIKDFDDILDHVGGWGRFQYFTTLVFFLFNVFLGYVYLSPIITLYTPPHSCRVPALANTTLADRRRLAIPPDPDTPSQCGSASKSSIRRLAITEKAPTREVWSELRQ